jgi:hypothetical protein
VERGHVAQRQPNQAGGSQDTGGTTGVLGVMVMPYHSEHWWYHGGRTSGVQQDVASGAAGGFIGRQPVTECPCIAGLSLYS